MNLNDKVKRLISEQPSKWKDKAKERIANKGWKKNSRAVALRILSILREKEMSQAALADLMGVSRQQVSKIVKGHENLTFETIDKLETALGVSLIKIEQGYIQPGITKFSLPVTTCSYKNAIKIKMHGGFNAGFSPLFSLNQQYSSTYDEGLYEKYNEDLCTTLS